MADNVAAVYLPMILATVANVAMILTPILIAAAAGFALAQWRSAQNTRMAQILLSVTERWDSQDMERCRCKVNASGDALKQKIQEANTSNSPELCDLVMVANFFDTVGVMIVEGLLSCKMGYQLFGRAEEHYYQIYRKILEDREEAEYFKYFVKLHEMFQKENEMFQKEKAAHLKTKRRLRM